MLWSSPRRWILLSIVAALVTLVIKFTAYWLTGSVGLLSDALESIINLLAALTATFAVWYAAQPADATHAYGHEKIEFFAAGLEGTLILIAAISIGTYAGERLLNPKPLERLDLGMGLSVLAAGINGVVGLLLVRTGRAERLLVLEADGQHLLTDVWTSGGVLAGVAMVWVTGWLWLDPVVALFVAANIAWTAFSLIKRSFFGLMDHALPAEEVAAIRAAIHAELPAGMAFHALRTRLLGGSRRAVDFHLLVPGQLSVAEAHQVGDQLEAGLHARFPDLDIVVHIEPIEEPKSWADHSLVNVEPRWPADAPAASPSLSASPSPSDTAAPAASLTPPTDRS